MRESHPAPSAPSARDVVIRRATEEDLLAMGTLAKHAYWTSDTQHLPRAWPLPEPPGPEQAAAWAERARGALTSDPAGVHVAQTSTEAGAEIVGMAVSRIREGLWILSSYAVDPGWQGLGIGHRLMEASLAYGRGCLRGIFCSSADPGAIRRYRMAGFDLHPMLALRGEVDRSALPVPARMRDGAPGDVDLMNSVDRATRGAAHGVDHEVLISQFPLRIVDLPTGQGYVYIGAHGQPVLLAATSTRLALDLMWESLAWATPGAVTEVFHVTAANQWALDVGLAARLSPASHGHLCVRTMKPPRNYLPHGSLL